MPDSFSLPPSGSPPFDERDLDSLLAGNTDVPQALRPVADTLSALRAAPSARELHDEAAARAQFRAVSGRAQVPAGQAAHTLQMPAVRGRGRYVRAGGTARQPRRGWFASLVAAAAVIVLGAAVAYTGHLPGPVQRIAHDTIAAPSPKNVTGGASAGVQANSAQPEQDRTQPAADSSPSSVTTSPGTGTQNRTTLCNQFWTSWQHSQPGEKEWWKTPLYDELSQAAGGPRQVYAYCAPVWERQPAHHYPQLPSYPPYFPHQQDFGKVPGQDQQQDPGKEEPGGAGR